MRKRKGIGFRTSTLLILTIVLGTTLFYYNKPIMAIADPKLQSDSSISELLESPNFIHDAEELSYFTRKTIIDIKYDSEIEKVEERAKEIKELKAKKAAEEARRKEEAARRKANQATIRKEIKPIPNTNLVEYDHTILPRPSYFNSYMNYSAITSRTSLQWRVAVQNGYGQNGLRFNNGYPLIAISKRFGNVGDLVKVYFQGGKSHIFMIGDIKSSRHLQSNQIYHTRDDSVIEFIIDKAHGQSIGRDYSSGRINDYGTGVIAVSKIRHK